MTATATARSHQRRLEAREQQERARRRRREKRTFLAAVGAVLAVVVTLVLVSVVTAPDSGPATKRVGVEPKLVAAVAGVPDAVLDAVGVGDATNLPRPVDDAVLTSDGRPEVLYIGAEYCPFCAAQRWPLIQALSRFGTFTGLSTTRSAADDVHPNTPTFTFHGAGYTSDYLTFTARELYTNERNGSGYVPLDEATAEETALLHRYGGGFPLLDLGGRYVQGGASFDPAVLHEQAWTDIAAAMSDPSTAIARGIDGSANVITSYLCQLTEGQPGAVCNAPAVKAVTASIHG